MKHSAAISPSHIWVEGASAFLAELTKLGFEAKLLKESSADVWKKITHPVSLKKLREGAVSHPEGFSYLAENALSEIPENLNLGLLIVDGITSAKFRDAGSYPQVSIVIEARNPDAAMDVLLKRSARPEWAGRSFPIPEGVLAEDGVVIGPDVEIGENTILEAGVRLGARVKIGRNCRIGAHSRICDDTVIGHDCTLSGHNVIGAQGFGLVQYPGEKFKRPRLHVGRVLIGNFVRLGAYVSIDRGVMDDTRVGDNSSFDNHVQVGHNSELGSGGVYCAFVGFAGSSKVGDDCVFAGMSGVKDHVTVGDRVIVAAQSGVSGDLKSDQMVKGYPPRPLTEALKIASLTSRLPEIYERVRKIEQKLKG